MGESQALPVRGLVVALLTLAACPGQGPERIGEAPSWRRTAPRAGAVAGPVTFAPASEPASRYNETPQPAPRSPLNDAVIAAVQDAALRAGLRLPVPDARLFRACAELAEVVPEEGIVGYTLVEFALQRNGIIEPSPHLLVVWGAIDAPRPIVEQLQPRLAEILADGATARVGVGAARRNPDGTGVVVFALQGSGVSTAPIQREVSVGGSVVVDAIVDPHYHDPEMFVTRDDGSTQRLELRPGRPNGFVSQIACGMHRGRQQVEITASDAAGSTVLANFPLWCGMAPPTSVTVDPAHDDVPAATPEEAERRVLASVNHDRVAAGLPALLWDDRVAEVARSHSEEMRRTHVVAHISPTTGSAADRVRAASIRTGVVLENVARAYGVNEAYQGLMNSPGHRANIMSGVATHIGIGVVFGEEVSGRREMFITQVFIRVPPKLDRPGALETVRQKLVAVRPALVHQPQLTALAQQVADALAAGQPRDQAYQRTRRQLDGYGRSYQRISSVITATADLDAIDGAGLLGDAVADEVGIGIAQGPHADLGDNAIWIVLLLANKRPP
ncbi:MAG TPA: CAP domain-containing protein [Kofleriaceae bacterium]|nr:CAP domain-containing protein [Kofleriaceae bacterium]